MGVIGVLKGVHMVVVGTECIDLEADLVKIVGSQFKWCGELDIYILQGKFQFVRP